MAKLAPSILSADFSKLAEQVALIEEGGAHIVHVDVMDGHFVPNISFGAVVMKSIAGKTTLPFDVHLMIEHPEKYIPDFVCENTAYITIHSETCKDDRKEVLNQIRDLGYKAGLAVNPETPLSEIEGDLEDIDMALVMSVHPGFGGQSFIEECLDKVVQLKKLREEKGYCYEIEIDGGINLDNVSKVKEAGCDIIVAGSAVFGAEDIPQRTRAFCEKLV